MLDIKGIINYTFVDLHLAQIANISAVMFQIYKHISLPIRSTARRTCWFNTTWWAWWDIKVIWGEQIF